jgi:putative nucleotidyltransferase with HDIG domain
MTTPLSPQPLAPANPATSPVSPTDGASLRATQLFVDIVKNSPNLAHDLREFKAAGALTLAIPEFAETWGSRGEQSPDWHPEGNVWTHTLMVVESLPQDASYGLKLAAIFHDIGKPATFFKYPTSGGITFAGHAQVGAGMLRRVIGPRLGIDSTTLEHAATIVEYHMFMHDFFKADRVGPEFQRHILNLPCIRDLIMIQHADVSGTGISLERKKDASYQSKLLQLLAELPSHS